MEVVLLSGENSVDVRVTSCSEQIMHSSTVGVDSVPIQTVVDNGGQGSHVWKNGPEAVEGADMRGVKLLGAASPEALTGVMKVPKVQVTYQSKLISAQVQHIHKHTLTSPH